RRAWRRRFRKLPPAAARSRNAMPARTRSGVGIVVAWGGPSHPTARVTAPSEGASRFDVPGAALAVLRIGVPDWEGGGPPLCLPRITARSARWMSSLALEYVLTSRGR